MSNLIWDDKELIRDIKSAAVRATERGAKKVLKKAKQNVRQKSKAPTGKLESEIDVSKLRIDKNKEAAAFAVIAQGPSNYTRFYASFVECGGHALYPYGNKKAAPVYIPARPFLRPAVRSVKRGILSDFDGVLDKI